MKPLRLVLATHNHGKRREWQALLEELPVTLVLPDELGLSEPVEETGRTYLENA
ncbi:MAG: non-canonical purine NTP pyrophosphatase, partial [Chloroflexi bacterium]|nr:non-canonical purine NTP pyrophosphatase [Chloroflexota bacterium]